MAVADADDVRLDFGHLLAAVEAAPPAEVPLAPMPSPDNALRERACRP